jgi:ferrochelatase
MALQGAILLNLGTPASPSQMHVKEYLKEFLMDPYVIDIHPVLRWFLVKGIIAPTRSRQSAAAYRQIWSERGSPLSFHLQDLVQKVEQELRSDGVSGDHWLVCPAMRYGKPSIESAFEQFKCAQVTDIRVFPLYPQYSLAATESSIQRCLQLQASLLPDAQLHFIKPFFDHPLFIGAFADIANEYLEKKFLKEPFDSRVCHFLFSFHGLPERHVKKLSPPGHCLKYPDCCQTVDERNALCYRAQCYATARALAEQMHLASQDYTVCFQSRLGRTPWIQPYTDKMYSLLAQRGIKTMIVLCPSFVADCLETLEEIQIRGRKQFLSEGGEDLHLIPSLNASSAWAKAVAQILQDY